MFASFFCVIKRELLLFYRSRQDTVNGLLFFFMVVALFPLTLDVDLDRLRLLAPGIIWMSALLASLLSMSQLFGDDYQQGYLSQMLFSPLPLSLIVLAKVMAHWLIFSLPLILLSPLVGLLFALTSATTWALALSLLLGTPILHLFAAFVAALSVGLRQANILFSLILLPLFVPVLVFGSRMVVMRQQHEVIALPLFCLAALLVLALTFMPLFAAFALRIRVADF